jgi:rubrerythrin
MLSHREAETVADLTDNCRSLGADIVWVCLECGARHEESGDCPETCAECGSANFWASVEH